MKRKILSLLTAFAMVFGIIAAPFTSASAADEKVSKAENAVTNTVTLHKLMMTKAELKAWKSEEIEKKGYDGTQDLAGLKAFLETNHSAHEADNVFFAWQVKGKEKNGNDNQYIKAVIDNETKKPKVVDGKISPAFDTKGELEFTTNLDEAFGGLTANKSGIKFDTSKLKGEFKIQEIKEKSTYQNEGKTIVDQKAVPVEITLPLVNKDGTVLDAHVYPKNTEDKPQLDKNFHKKGGMTQADGFKAADEGAEATVGAKIGNETKTKATAKSQVGKVVPYEVKTKIASGTSYERLVWNDTMDNGLTYNKDLATSKYYNNENILQQEQTGANITTGISIFKLNAQGEHDGNAITLTKDKDYTILEDDRGFRLKFEEAGLKKISDITKPATGEAADVEVQLVYTATVNGSAEVDVTQTNDVKLEYGHKPDKDVEPKEGSPKEGKIQVEKKWGANGDQQITDADKDVVVVYTLQKKNGQNWENVESVTKKFVKKGEKIDQTAFNHEFTGLKDTDTYRVVERVSGYTPENTVFENGKTTYKNVKDNDNPPPLETTEPKIVVGGKKFVKTDDQDKKTANRLMSAQFVIKNEKGDKYLFLKSDANKAADLDKLNTAKKAYEKAIDDYNTEIAKDGAKEESVSITVGEEKVTGKTEILKKVAALRDAYEKAFKKQGVLYEFKALPSGKTVENAENIVRLTSDNEGRFEIQGLEYGKYQLEETRQPKGFAKLSDVGFTVAKGTYKGADTEMEYTPKDATNTGYGQQVKNKKVTIPQTGGIGSLVFIAAGLVIMGGAFIAYRRSQATA
ncbi:pilin N-terminal domain-containing protein [uncultured Anaerococcus sp.]|uniref:pilin N-terminal domain-containing protein n=1 Tax=uncultured Anaerococcus sp. TaxID=293428 RepID=UPI00288922C7|nr:pilin N-terminal domain-containing protein [uncultured Anaerococcus sp.]